MPQFDKIILFSEVFWVFIIFVLFYFVFVLLNKAKMLSNFFLINRIIFIQLASLNFLNLDSNNVFKVFNKIFYTFNLDILDTGMLFKIPFVYSRLVTTHKNLKIIFSNL